MGIRFETSDGQIGQLDVVQMVQQKFGPDAKITGVKDGLVIAQTAEGVKRFSLAEWSDQYQAQIVHMDGFNSPETAIDQPPNGMNYMDQSVFYHDGMDMDALRELFPQAQEQEDGRIVVLDNDGLWKIMWSPMLVAPSGPMTFDQEVDQGLVNDPKLVLRTAGVTFLFALAGKTPVNGSKGGVKVAALVEVLRIIGRNTPAENKYQIGKMMQQTVGIDPWKMTNAFMAPEDTGAWLKKALTMSSFEYRMVQMEMAEIIVKGMRGLAQQDFQEYMAPVGALPETKNLMINLKQVFGEFIQMLVGLDLLRDISRTTGLNEWIALNEDSAFDKTKLPDMPKFVEAFVVLLRWIMPIVQDANLGFARGKAGFKSIVALMNMLDDCMYSLADVPDTSAKYKMFMAVKKVQTMLENKLSFHYQPDPLKNKDGLLENPFMKAKGFYTEKREQVYKLCQTPKEAWNNTLLESLRSAPNIEQFYDSLPDGITKLMRSFAAMDVAYDMQPWADVTHADRTHDSFSEFNESFGLRPPEAGYLAKNSPRAIFNISETLVQGSAYLSEMGAEKAKAMLRNPFLLAQLFKTLMTASVNRELGTVEVLNKFGGEDIYASPDATRIWEDPEMVEKEQQAQIEEMMGALAMEAAAKNQGKQQQGEQQAMQQEQMGAEKAGAGPEGAPMRVRQAG